MSSALAAELQPIQLGIGARMGCKAAVHAVRDCTDSQVGTPDTAIIKLDLSNAFNTVRRSAILREVFRRFPAATPLVSQAYSQPSPLQFGPNRLWSCLGVQQAVEERKRQRYAALALRYDFTPLAVETSGVLGPAFNDLLRNIGRRVSQRSGEPRDTAWLRAHQFCRGAW
ncbi:hypothetical protein O3P69_008977 [Scylla paramamosain]|uniref:Reverse transcriptase n=1 Tax=Scylla paramamosain TaxID=85552 RepID=A0AAW0TPH0_SCYPA